MRALRTLCPSSLLAPVWWLAMSLLVVPTYCCTAQFTPVYFTHPCSALSFTSMSALLTFLNIIPPFRNIAGGPHCCTARRCLPRYIPHECHPGGLIFAAVGGTLCLVPPHQLVTYTHRRIPFKFIQTHIVVFRTRYLAYLFDCGIYRLGFLNHYVRMVVRGGRIPHTN